MSLIDRKREVKKEYRKYEKTWEQEERVFMNPVSD